MGEAWPEDRRRLCVRFSRGCPEAVAASSSYRPILSLTSGPVSPQVQRAIKPALAASSRRTRPRLPAGEEPRDRRAEALRCLRTTPRHCTAGSSPVLGERPRCGRRHGRTRCLQDTGDGDGTPQFGCWLSRLPAAPAHLLTQPSCPPSMPPAAAAQAPGSGSGRRKTSRSPRHGPCHPPATPCAGTAADTHLVRRARGPKNTYTSGLYAPSAHGAVWLRSTRAGWSVSPMPHLSHEQVRRRHPPCSGPR